MFFRPMLHILSFGMERLVAVRTLDGRYTCRSFPKSFVRVVFTFVECGAIVVDVKISMEMGLVVVVTAAVTAAVMTMVGIWGVFVCEDERRRFFS